MPRDSNGTYSLPPVYFATTGQTILAEQHNVPMADIATALTGSLPRNGTGAMLANLPMGGYKATNLGNGTNPQDAATKSQVDAVANSIDAAIDAVEAELATQIATRVPTTRAVNTSGLATGGGALSADRTINVPIASQAQATGGTDNATAMTPLRVRQAIEGYGYKGSSGSETNYPVRTYLSIIEATPSRNQSFTPFLAANNAGAFTANGANSAGTLAGTWSSRGVASNASTITAERIF